MTVSLSFFLRFRLQTVSLLLLLGTSLLASAQTIRYVRTDGTNPNPATATTWSASTTNLQGAIDASTPGDQVWVAQGTYKPGGNASTDRSISFAMKNGVAIYGGFVGNETELSARPAVSPITDPSGASQPSSSTLSGDIGEVGNTADNSYHVIYNVNILTTTAVLDGFVITGGKADGNNLPNNSGGGMYNNGVGTGKDCSPLIRNCSFQNNSATEGGGGLFNDGSFSGRNNATLTNCSFQNNSASSGGAIFNKGESNGSDTGADCSPVLANCSFQSNSATVGGAMVNDAQSAGRSNPMLTNCSFQDNSAADKGGAIFNNGTASGTSNPTLTNCSFQSNSATVGGAIYNDAYGSGTSSPTLTNCSFQNNLASTGGAMYSKAIVGTAISIPTLTNCVVFGNGGGNTFARESSSPVVANYSLFENTVGDYSGSNNLTTTVSPFVSPTDTRLNACSPAINAGNNADYTTASGGMPPSPTTDLAGNLRFFENGLIDMGAYEYQATPGIITIAPSISTATVGVAFSQTVVASGGATGSPDRPYTYTVASGTLPLGLSLTTTGVLSGTPTQSGNFTSTLQATDASGCVGTDATYTLTVTALLTITALSPTRNVRNAPATTNVAITFDEPISSGTATLGALRVFSQQRGGLLRNGQGGTTTASSNTLTFDPATDFRPGETILTTLTSSAQSSAGVNLNRGYVHQFTVGTGGTGRGNFTPPATNPDPTVGSGSRPFSVVLGDVDGDGDLDFVTANSGTANPSTNNVTVRLNNGSGNFAVTSLTSFPVGSGPRSVALGDVDGDGDLDFIVANTQSQSVSVRLNNGLGNFILPATNPDPTVGIGPTSVALGDVDGDGDLDFITANSGTNNVSVRLNNGSGNFTPHLTNPDPTVGTGPNSVVLGDVDGDGDLDLLTANVDSNNVSVLLNDGSGNFTPPVTNPTSFTVGNSPASMALGDVDGDGDLDFITANESSGDVSIRLNNGAGNFSPHPTNPALDFGPISVALGDVDSDGDLDLLTVNDSRDGVSILLNNGLGNFTLPATNPNPAVGDSPRSVALGDVDGDGDLDFITANRLSDNVSVRLNQPVTSAISGFTANPTAACVGSVVTFTATVDNVTSPYNFTLTNGSSSTLGSAMSSVFSQTLTASGSGPQAFTLIVSSNGQEASATTSITVNTLPVAGLTTNGPLTCAQTSLTLTATPAGQTGETFSYVFSAGATQIGTTNRATVNAPGTYSVTVTDANGCVSTTSTTVSSNTAVVTVGNPTVTTAIQGQPFSQTFTALGGVGPYSFSLASGNLPTSLSLSTTTGVLSGTPTQTGSFTFTVRATDANSCVGVGATYSLTVNAPVVNPPTITGLAASPSPVCAGSPITFTATVSNVNGPYNYTLTNGSNGVTGTANSVAFSQVLTAGIPGSQSFTLIVNNGGPVATAITTVLVNPLPTVSLLVTGGVLHVSGGVLFERVIVIDRINGYEIRQTDSNTTGFFALTRTGPYRMTVTDGNGCQTTVESRIETLP